MLATSPVGVGRPCVKRSMVVNTSFEQVRLLSVKLGPVYLEVGDPK